MHDLVIRNGTVIDGTGAPARTADVAIDGDRVTAVGEIPESGAEEIDATGLLVTPGFVDIHTHYDGQVIWDPEITPSSWHGVTSIVMGNCGVGFAPVRPDRHEFLISVMEGVEDIPGPPSPRGSTSPGSRSRSTSTRSRRFRTRSMSARRCPILRCGFT